MTHLRVTSTLAVALLGPAACGAGGGADDADGTAGTEGSGTSSPSSSSGASTSGGPSGSSDAESTSAPGTSGSDDGSASDESSSGGGSNLECVKLQSFEGADVPTNQAGEGYPSIYEGAATIDIAVDEGWAGNALRVTLDDAYAQVQWNPYSGSSRGFTREYLEDPSAWEFDTFNRLRFRLLSPTNGPALATTGQSNMDVGQYVKTVDPADPGSDEEGGGHPYNGINVAPTGTWSIVELNMHPDHWRGADGNEEHGFAEHPTEEDEYNYYDALTRFYLDVASEGPPAVFLIDEIEFCRDPDPENDEQIYTFVATYVPEDNRVIVTWDRNKDENAVAHEVRYAFESVHAIGWDAATPAPDGTVVPPGESGYNNMVYDNADWPLDGASMVYIAVKPQNSDLFSQIELPL